MVFCGIKVLDILQAQLYLKTLLHFNVIKRNCVYIYALVRSKSFNKLTFWYHTQVYIQETYISIFTQNDKGIEKFHTFITFSEFSCITTSDIFLSNVFLSINIKYSVVL